MNFVCGVLVVWRYVLVDQFQQRRAVGVVEDGRLRLTVRLCRCVSVTVLETRKTLLRPQVHLAASARAATGSVRFLALGKGVEQTEMTLGRTSV